MSRRHRGKIIDLQISSLDKKGLGVGSYAHPAGITWEVATAFTAPGDQVSVQLQGKKSGRYQSRLQEVLSPSPLRVTPRCAHFGVCGGCRLQHLNYQEEAKWKESLVRKALSDVVDENSRFYPILPSKSEWNWRNKMEFSFHTDKSGNRYLGLIRFQGRGRVENLGECHLTSSWTNGLLEVLRGWWKESGLESYNFHVNEGSLRALMVRESRKTGDKMVVLTVSGNPDYALTKAQIESFREAVVSYGAPEKLSLFLRIHQMMKGKPTQLYDIHLAGEETIREELQLEGRDAPLRLFISPSSFFQPNTEMAEVLYSRALELAEVQSEELVFDLYSGTGTLALAASTYAKQVVGVEIVREAVYDARKNAECSGIENVEFLPRDVAEVLKERKQEVRPSLIMVDPPRVGLGDEVIELLGEINVPKLLYIACNPFSQKEDIQKLQSFGYRVDAVQPLDQFPKTAHVENIVVLKRQ